LGETLRYSLTDAFEPFPFCEHAIPELTAIGTIFHSTRDEVMLELKIGLTAICNEMSDKTSTGPAIGRLRNLQVELDRTVVAAYGWTDLNLDHGFHETKQGLRYTISEPARREVLQRLLKLNHERYAEEEKQGLHGKKKGAAKSSAPKKKAAKEKEDKPQKPATPLFDFGDEDE
jgi:hypothetical protein